MFKNKCTKLRVLLLSLLINKYICKTNASMSPNYAIEVSGCKKINFTSSFTIQIKTQQKNQKFKRATAVNTFCPAD